MKDEVPIAVHDVVAQCALLLYIVKLGSNVSLAISQPTPSSQPSHTNMTYEVLEA